MLGLNETRMIAAMIKSNPPLTTLNLEVNNLNPECAQLIAVALLSNTSLKLLNLSNNKLGDHGVTWILQSLIKRQLMDPVQPVNQN
jgi:Ran GTPase-activating protein (RanGAP) involved in mRNA processing and transport